MDNRESSLNRSLIKTEEEEQLKSLADSPERNKNFLEDSISMIERTSIKIYPIVKEVLKKMIEETSKDTINAGDKNSKLK